MSLENINDHTHGQQALCDGEGNAIYAIRRENSLFCPKRNPISHARLFSSLCLPSKNLDTIGLTISIAIDKIIAAIATSGKNLRLKPAPIEKKNIIKKKSRRGLSVSAIC